MYCSWGLSLLHQLVFLLSLTRVVRKMSFAIDSPQDRTLSTRHPTPAAAPFDHEKADVILRSSDNVDFRVFKLFLSLASPFFETLFDIPQPAEASVDQEFKDGLAVIPVAEDSKTLDALLCFCYPCTLAEDPYLDLLEDVLSVLEAAKKYSLDAIEIKICQSLSNSKILEAEPLRCFAIAHRGQLLKETLLAAKCTLTQPLIPSMFKEIELITAVDLLALLTYHQQCGDAVYALRTDMSWIKSHYETSQGCGWLSGRYISGTSYGSPVYNNCQCPRSLVPKFLLFETHSLQWWEDFMDETFVVLRDKPCKATVKGFAAKTVHSVRVYGCSACSTNIEEGMRGFCDLLAKKIDEVVSLIKLDLDLQESSSDLKGGSPWSPKGKGRKGKKLTETRRSGTNAARRGN